MNAVVYKRHDMLLCYSRQFFSGMVVSISQRRTHSKFMFYVAFFFLLKCTRLYFQINVVIFLRSLWQMFPFFRS